MARKMTNEERQQRKEDAAKHRAEMRKSVHPRLIFELKREEEDRNRFYMGRTYPLNLRNVATSSAILHGGHHW